MRFIVLFLAFTLSCAFNVYGQEYSSSTSLTKIVAESSDNGSSLEGVGDSKTGLPKETDQEASQARSQDKVDISKATDGQINEAQRFYKACSNNEQLNSQHDCKCLAGEYLAARISRGDDASYKQVFSDVRKLCLTNPEEKSNLDDVTSSDAKEEFTDAEITEANNVYQWCKTDTYMPLYHDCKCLASEFVMKRRELGRLPNRDHVLSELKGKCLDGTGMAGYLYKDCISKPALLPMHLKNVKKFCECYASQFSKNFEGLEGTDVSMNATGALARSSMSKCQNEQREFTLK